MDFVNHTPFPSLAFEGIDQHNQSFHVLVLRQTLTWKDDGILTYTDEQEPLCEQDVFIGEMNQSTVRQESDLCHYKPQCDVIANAVAYAPQNQPVPSFGVHLAVKRSGMDKPLVSKTLRLLGKREFVWSNGTLVENGVTLSQGWHLTAPTLVTSVPVCAEFAFGGGYQLNHSEPVPLVCFMPNPIGKGFTSKEFIQATNIVRFPAPQVEYWHKPLTVADFERCLLGQLSEEEAASLVASLTIRPKTHPKRSCLVGTIDDAFIESDAWLPEDFNFAIWNATPPDQQCAFLEGNETIELFNLCPANMPAAKVNDQGQTVLSLTLPSQSCFVLVRMENGSLFTLPMNIDTLIIEPQFKRVSVVWRLILQKNREDPIRAIEARMISFQERDAAHAEMQKLLAQLAQTENSKSEEVAHG